jgi:hypothetical protein
VIWTQHAHLKDELAKYIDKSLDAAKPHARPLAILALPKERFINLETGNITEAAKLRDEIGRAIAESPQLLALLNWETAVLSAAGSTLAALLELVPQESRNASGYSAGIDEVLSRLAREAVGKSNVASDARAAINVILAPIMSDMIVSRAASNEDNELWKKAITRSEDSKLGNASLSDAGRFNRMLHVAKPEHGTIRASDWGAVIELPKEWLTDEHMNYWFGVTLKELLGSEFKIPSSGLKDCRACLIRVGAVCDHAQGKKGPNPYIFGFEIPASVERMKDKTGKDIARPASTWSSPILSLLSAEVPFHLVCSCRFTISLTSEVVKAWQLRYRIREQMLMQLITHANAYMARPGIVQLPAN